MNSIESIVDEIKAYDGPPLRFMEICGTHTYSILKYGIGDILPPNISLVSGPGCPVCVTPAGFVDYAAQLSLRKNSVLCTFGDMVRVPGHTTSLAKARASGGAVQIMYAPMDVIGWAENAPGMTFYIAAVGFETTLPIYALLLKEITVRKLRNIRFLTAMKALLPALYWICEKEPRMSGFIGPGHVSTIIGTAAYEPLRRKYGVPLAVAGFGFEHILAAIYDLMTQCRLGTHAVKNLYPNAVSHEGNAQANALIAEYFIKKPSLWRGLGQLDASGYFLAPSYEGFDAGDWMENTAAPEPSGCLCGSVIIGRASPPECALFGSACTPQEPVGPCMVSGEGACGIWYRSGAAKKEHL